MRKFVLLGVLLAFAGIANAQFFTMGLKGGINTTTGVVKNINFEDKAGTQWQVLKNNAKVGFQIGAFARVKLLGFYVQPELYYSQSRTELPIKDLTTSNVRNEISKMNTLNLPILVGYKFGPLRVNAGPVANFMLSKVNVIENVSGLKESMNTANWGFQAGVGIDLLKTITLDARYEGSLSTVGSAYNNVSGSKINFGSHPQQFIFTVGVFLF